MDKNDLNSSRPITLLVTDDSALYREGLCALITHWHEFEVVGIAANGLEAIGLFRALQPDLTLMDIHMPVMDGVETMCEILREFPSAQIVMMAISGEDSRLFDAIRLGACGYILKEVSSRRLHHLLRDHALRKM